MKQKVSGTITPEGELRVTTESAGRIDTTTRDWPAGALMNEGQRLEAKRHGLKEGVAYKSKYFDPDLLVALDVEVTIGKKERLDLFGRVVEGTKVTLKMSIRDHAIELVMFVDDELDTLFTTTNRMGMKIDMIACTEQYALSENNPQEVVKATFIPSPKALSQKQRERTLRYTLHRPGATEALRIVETPEQRVVPKDGKQIVTVTKQAPPREATMPYKGDDPAALEALKPNRWVQSDAEEIEKMAEKARAGATDASEAARHIERFVSEYIEEKDLSVGYASALEVAKSKQGDCTEHALLTAALCRASGIPAEIVFGLVYVEEFEDERALFGGHAWTRVHLNGKWLSLDAALEGFDTGHIALALSDGDPADFFRIIDVIGNLEILSID
jgi:hypothetical protein